MDSLVSVLKETVLLLNLISKQKCQTCSGSRFQLWGFAVFFPLLNIFYIKFTEDPKNERWKNVIKFPTGALYFLPPAPQTSWAEKHLSKAGWWRNNGLSDNTLSLSSCVSYCDCEDIQRVIQLIEFND